MAFRQIAVGGVEGGGRGGLVQRINHPDRLINSTVTEEMIRSIKCQNCSLIRSPKRLRIFTRFGTSSKLQALTGERTWVWFHPLDLYVCRTVRRVPRRSSARRKAVLVAAVVVSACMRLSTSCGGLV